jgi:putative two-component system response regulator
MNSPILLVDDNVDFAETTGEALRRRGFEVVTATDGYAAADQLQKHQFNLMISDIVMPGMNGPQLIGYAKQRWPDLKVIMVSGEATAVTKGRLKDLGADGFLEKPFRMQKLLAMVKSEMKAPVKAPVEHKKRILIADDNREFLESATEYLSTRGYEVTAVGDGSRAWQSVRRDHLYYAIVLDINMPRMDGIETVKAIRQVDRGVNIVCISGEAFKGEMEAAAEFGANSFLPKPFAMEKLASLIEKKADRAPVVSEHTIACQSFGRAPTGGAVKEWARQFNSCPVAVCGIAVALLLVCVMFILSNVPNVTLNESPENQVNRLIRAIELDWGR